jgi:hypothetical protein
VLAARLALLGLVVVAGAAVGVAAFVLNGGDEAALPACARAKISIARPATLPARFPFPDGTVFTRSFRNRMSHGVPAAAGLLPLGMDDAVRFFDRELPHAGFDVMVRFGAPLGSEAFYAVKGFSGRYEIEELRSCAQATSFVITARPTLLGRGFSQ